jgi:phosphonate transport system substrate-binding protein
MRTTRRLVLALLAAAALGSCGDSKPASAKAAPTGREGWPAEVRFGLVPSEGGTDIVERFGPMIRHMEKELGIPVRGLSASDYQGVITAMQNDQVEVAYFGPQSYVIAHRIAGAEAIVKELSDAGVSGFWAILVARKDSGCTSLADAKGRSLAFVSPASTSGYLVPAVALESELKIPVGDYFGSIVFTQSHGSSVQRVINGDIDVAATNTMDLRAMAIAGLVDQDALVEIWRSELIPASPIAVRSELPESFKEALRDAIVSFSEDAEALAQMGRVGYVPASDGEYDVIRLLEQRKAELEAAAGGN